MNNAEADRLGGTLSLWVNGVGIRLRSEPCLLRDVRGHIVGIRLRLRNLSARPGVVCSEDDLIRQATRTELIRLLLWQTEQVGHLLSAWPGVSRFHIRVTSDMLRLCLSSPTLLQALKVLGGVLVLEVRGDALSEILSAQGRAEIPCRVWLGDAGRLNLALC